MSYGEKAKKLVDEIEQLAEAHGHLPFTVALELMLWSAKREGLSAEEVVAAMTGKAHGKVSAGPGTAYDWPGWSETEEQLSAQ